MAGQRGFPGGPLDLYCWGSWLWAIMPEVPRANTHLTTVAIAELMADRLKGAR